MKRLFVALKIDPGFEFIEKYGDLKHELGHEQIKWVEEHNIHVTLKFFGETVEHKIPGISSILKTRSKATSSFDCRLSGLGIFGSSYSPKVIWVGIEPFNELSSLMKLMHDDLKAIGFDPDRQNLVPHLTVGRIKFLRDRVVFNRVIEKYKLISSGTIHLAEMVLFESKLHPEGPEYIVLEKYPFIKKELP